MRRAFRWVSVGVAAAALAIGGAEIALQIRSAALQAARRDVTELQRRNRAYRAFNIQHPHPHYMFFFPLDPGERLALANAVCSLDADGFREPGPAHAGGRKLAFLLGGSAAFGDLASSNDQTITSHLNRLQGEFFFVNAGVPSWNSTQELMRLAVDIVERRPALVVAYDGSNDAVLAGQIREQTGSPYPPGTPEFFDILDRLVAEEPEPLSERLHPRTLLPELTLRMDKWFFGVDTQFDDEDVASDADIAAAARRYRANHARMAELTAAAGGRFVAAFQPVANLHTNADRTEIPQRPLIEKFHREATAGTQPDYAFVDLSRAFEGLREQLKLAGPNLETNAVFVDPVHLTDRGNALVAEQLWSTLTTSVPAPR